VNKQLSFINKQRPKKATVGIYLYTDGAARNNPGPAGAGIVLKRDNETILKDGFFLGNKTNNQAEYLALILGLLIVKEKALPNENIYVHSDSELLVKQISGLYRVKNPKLQHLFRVACMISKNLNIHFKHILRNENQEADTMANHGIETKTSIPASYSKVLNEYRIEI